MSESDMALILAEVEKEEEEEARKDAEHAQFIKNRDEKKLAIQAALKSGLYWKGQVVANYGNILGTILTNVSLRSGGGLLSIYLTIYISICLSVYYRMLPTLCLSCRKYSY